MAPSMEEMGKLIVDKVVKKTLSDIKLKNGQPAISLFGDFTHLYINPSGKFIIGGPRVMLASRGGRSSLTPTVAGVRTVAARSPGRTPRRWTGPLPTSAGRWRSPW